MTSLEREIQTVLIAHHQQQQSQFGSAEAPQLPLAALGRIYSDGGARCDAGALAFVKIAFASVRSSSTAADAGGDAVPRAIGPLALECFSALFLPRESDAPIRGLLPATDVALRSFVLQLYRDASAACGSNGDTTAPSEIAGDNAAEIVELTCNILARLIAIDLESHTPAEQQRRGAMWAGVFADLLAELDTTAQQQQQQTASTSALLARQKSSLVLMWKCPVLFARKALFLDLLDRFVIAIRCSLAKPHLETAAVAALTTALLFGGNHRRRGGAASSMAGGGGETSRINGNSNSGVPTTVIRVGGSVSRRRARDDLQTLAADVMRVLLRTAGAPEAVVGDGSGSGNSNSGRLRDEDADGRRFAVLCTQLLCSTDANNASAAGLLFAQSLELAIDKLLLIATTSPSSSGALSDAAAVAEADAKRRIAALDVLDAVCAEACETLFWQQPGKPAQIFGKLLHVMLAECKGRAPNPADVANGEAATRLPGSVDATEDVVADLHLRAVVSADVLLSLLTSHANDANDSDSGSSSSGGSSDDDNDAAENDDGHDDDSSSSSSSHDDERDARRRAGIEAARKGLCDAVAAALFDLLSRQQCAGGGDNGEHDAALQTQRQQRALVLGLRLSCYAVEYMHDHFGERRYLDALVSQFILPCIRHREAGGNNNGIGGAVFLNDVALTTVCELAKELAPAVFAKRHGKAIIAAIFESFYGIDCSSAAAVSTSSTHQQRTLRPAFRDGTLTIAGLEVLSLILDRIEDDLLEVVPSATAAHKAKDKELARAAASPSSSSATAAATGGSEKNDDGDGDEVVEWSSEDDEGDDDEDDEEEDDDDDNESDKGKQQQQQQKKKKRKTKKLTKAERDAELRRELAAAFAGPAVSVAEAAMAHFAACPALSWRVRTAALSLVTTVLNVATVFCEPPGALAGRVFALALPLLDDLAPQRAACKREHDAAAAAYRREEQQRQRAEAAARRRPFSDREYFCARTSRYDLPDVTFGEIFCPTVPPVVAARLQQHISGENSTSNNNNAARDVVVHTAADQIASIHLRKLQYVYDALEAATMVLNFGHRSDAVMRAASERVVAFIRVHVEDPALFLWCPCVDYLLRAITCLVQHFAVDIPASVLDLCLPFLCDIASHRPSNLGGRMWRHERGDVVPANDTRFRYAVMTSASGDAEYVNRVDNGGAKLVDVAASVLFVVVEHTEEAAWRGFTARLLPHARRLFSTLCDSLLRSEADFLVESAALACASLAAPSSVVFMLPKAVPTSNENSNDNSNGNVNRSDDGGVASGANGAALLSQEEAVKLLLPALLFGVQNADGGDAAMQCIDAIKNIVGLLPEPVVLEGEELTTASGAALTGAHRQRVLEERSAGGFAGLQKRRLDPAVFELVRTLHRCCEMVFECLGRGGAEGLKAHSPVPLGGRRAAQRSGGGGGDGGGNEGRRQSRRRQLQQQQQDGSDGEDSVLCNIDPDSRFDAEWAEQLCDVGIEAGETLVAIFSRFPTFSGQFFTHTYPIAINLLTRVPHLEEVREDFAWQLLATGMELPNNSSGTVVLDEKLKQFQTVLGIVLRCLEVQQKDVGRQHTAFYTLAKLAEMLGAARAVQREMQDKVDAEDARIAASSNGDNNNGNNANSGSASHENSFRTSRYRAYTELMRWVESEALDLMTAPVVAFLTKAAAASTSRKGRKHRPSGGDDDDDDNGDDAAGRSAGYCKDNAVRAALELLLLHEEGSTAQRKIFAGSILPALPLRHDLTEAVHVHKAIAQLLADEERCGAVIGGKNREATLKALRAAKSAALDAETKKLVLSL